MSLLDPSIDRTPLELEEALFQRDQEIAMFKVVGMAVRERFDLDSIFRMVATLAKDMIKAETVLIPVLDPDLAHYTYRAGCGLNADEIVGETLDINLGLCGWVWKHQRPWWRGVLEDLSDEERNQWEREVGTIIMVPMRGHGHFLGGIAGINKVGGGDFDRRDLDLLTLLASQVAIAIDNNALIEQLEKLNHALSSEKEKAQVTLSSIGDAVITTDNQGRIEYMNPVAERMFDTLLADAGGKPLAQLGTLLEMEGRRPSVDLVEHSLIEGGLSRQFGTLVLTRKDGTELFVDPNASPIRDEEGFSSGIVFIFRDVSQAHELTRQLSHQASHDLVTGLYNRRECEERVKSLIRDAVANGTQHSMLYLDLDQFKVVNDTCGHAAGDELLKLYSAKLLAMLGPDDFLARVGGDEFGVLLGNASTLRSLEFARRIQDMTQHFRFVWEDKTYSIGVSIGLIGIDSHSASVAAVMSRVDAACHMAKEEGRSRIYMHDESDEALHVRHGEMQWTPRITKALEDNRMVLFFQPIARREAPADLSSHYEILIRMRDENGGLIPPGAFLPAAERYNLIASIDRWVVGSYFRWLAEHPAQLQSLALGSINLSGSSLSDENCLRYIESRLREFAIPPEKICFEITETEAIANLSKAVHFIHRLKDHGCRFALDDFGSGFSSYAYLKNLPVDFLKIDGMFIKDVATDQANYAMVESINHIGHVMGRKTIAEFVEDQAIIRTLGELGVDFMQGYGIAKPRPIGDLI